MSRFGKRDVTEILELLEKELDSVQRLDRVHKMKLRSRIRQQENWIVASEDPKPAKVLLKLEGRLAEIFRLFPSSSKDKVGELLKAKCSKLEREKSE